MSVHEAIAWAIEVSRGEPMPARMLLIVGLAARCGDRENGFVVWPSYRQIAEDTDMSRPSVKRWMKHLEDKQFVEKFAAVRADGGKSSNRYRLPVKAVFYHPTKGAMPRAGVSVDHGGGITMNPGGGHSYEPSPGSSAEPCIEQPLEQPLEGSQSAPAEEELDLGLPPVPSKQPGPADVAEAISEGWAMAAGGALQPLRGGKLSEENAEKAYNLAAKAIVGDQTVLDVWSEIFAAIRGSDFLQGRVEGRDGRPPFRLSLSWLLEKRNFVKVLEGRFSGQSTGERKRGSTSTATGNVLDRLRAGRQQRAGRGGPAIADSRGSPGAAAGGPRG